MYPAPFDYQAPTSLDDVLGLLDEHGEDAKVVAGGQSLVPLLKLRFAEPALLVDLGRVGGLDDVVEDGGGLRIGALARHNQLAGSGPIRAHWPAAAAAAPLIADPLIRNRGTLGGSLAHADPAGDWASVMLALGATVHARSTTGERPIPMADFLQGPFTTALEPTEVITEVRVPRPRGPSGGTYLKLERKVGDFASVGAAVQLELSDGVIGRAGIALTAVGPQNIQAVDAERSLIGVAPVAEAFDEAADLAARAASPTTDLRGSAEYKRHVVRVFVRRGLDRALESARAREE